MTKSIDGEFDREGESIAASVNAFITQDESQFARQLAVEGAGLAYLPQVVVARELESGVLQGVLQSWLSPGPGYHVYYSSRRQLPEGLRLLIELIRELRPLGL